MQNIKKTSLNKKATFLVHKTALLLLLLTASSLFAAPSPEQAKTINDSITPPLAQQNNDPPLSPQPGDNPSAAPLRMPVTAPGSPEEVSPVSGGLINGAKQDNSKIISPAPAQNNNPTAPNNYQQPGAPQNPNGSPNDNYPMNQNVPNEPTPPVTNRGINDQSKVINVNSISAQLPTKLLTGPATATAAAQTSMQNTFNADQKTTVINSASRAINIEAIAPTTQGQKTTVPSLAKQGAYALDSENENAEYINPRMPVGRQAYFSDYQNFLPQELVSIQENYKNFNTYYKKLAHQRSRDIKIKLASDSDRIRFMLQGIESKDNLAKIKQLPAEIKNIATQQMADYRLLDIATKTALASFIVKGDQSAVSDDAKATDYINKNKTNLAKFFTLGRHKTAAPTPTNNPPSQPQSSSAPTPVPTPNTPTAPTPPPTNSSTLPTIPEAAPTGTGTVGGGATQTPMQQGSPTTAPAMQPQPQTLK